MLKDDFQYNAGGIHSIYRLKTLTSIGVVYRACNTRKFQFHGWINENQKQTQAVINTNVLAATQPTLGKT